LVREKHDIGEETNTKLFNRQKKQKKIIVGKKLKE
jgi:hypothetical protein